MAKKSIDCPSCHKPKPQQSPYGHFFSYHYCHQCKQSFVNWDNQTYPIEISVRPSKRRKYDPSFGQKSSDAIIVAALAAEQTPAPEPYKRKAIYLALPRVQIIYAVCRIINPNGPSILDILKQDQEMIEIEGEMAEIKREQDEICRIASEISGQPITDWKKAYGMLNNFVVWMDDNNIKWREWK